MQWAASTFVEYESCASSKIQVGHRARLSMIGIKSRLKSPVAIFTLWGYYILLLLYVQADYGSDLPSIGSYNIIVN